MIYNELTINKTKIKYRDEGKGIPILFLPGFTGNDNIWDNQIDELSSKFRLITINLSEASFKSNNLNNLIDIINEFVLSINIDYLYIVGYSIGALLALKYANNYPEKIIGVSISSLGHISNSEFKRIKYYINDYTYIKNFWKRLFFKLINKNNSNYNIANNFSNSLKFNTIKQELDSLPHPLLIINGEFDHYTCQKTASNIYKTKNNVQFEILEQGRKDCFNSNYLIYNEILTNFINSIKL